MRMLSLGQEKEKRRSEEVQMTLITQSYFNRIEKLNLLYVVPRNDRGEGINYNIRNAKEGNWKNEFP